MTLEEAKKILKKENKSISDIYAEKNNTARDAFEEYINNTNSVQEAAKQSNDASLDEQAKKIKEQKKLIDSLQSKLAEADGNYKFAMEKLKKIESQKKEIKHLNKLLISRNKEIWDLNERLKGMKKLSKEIDRLHAIIRGKEDLLNKYRISDCNKEEMIAALREELAEAKGEKPYPTEDDPEEVSLSDMVKTVIDAFFDGKSVYIK